MAISFVGRVKKINTDKLIVPLSIWIFAFFMCFRSETVGADTKQYTNGFLQIANSRLRDIFDVKVFGVEGGYTLNFEYGYRLYNKLVSFVSDNSQAIVVAVGLLIIILLLVNIKKYSTDPVLSIWLYLTLGIFQTEMNMSRNAIAIFICYLGLEYIREKKLLKFIIAILIGTLFHKSSILFFPLYWLIGGVKLTPKLVRNILLSAVLLGLGFSVIRPFITSLLPFKYAIYFMGNTTKFESLIVGIFHCGLVLMVLLLTNKKDRIYITEREPIGIWMFISEIFFFSVGYDVSAAARMAALFGPYIIFLIPNMINKGMEDNNKKIITTLLIVIISGLQFIVRLNINNIGTTMPYSFFWD